MRERSDLQEERRQKSKKKPTSQKQHLTIETSLSLLLLPVQFLSSTSASMLFEFSLFLSTLIFELFATAHTHKAQPIHIHNPFHTHTNCISPAYTIYYSTHVSYVSHVHWLSVIYLLHISYYWQVRFFAFLAVFFIALTFVSFTIHTHTHTSTHRQSENA